MASSNMVKIRELTQITPNSNSTSEFSLPLTFFDTFWFKFPPVERLFFYQITQLTPNFFNSVIFPKLKQSLSLTLLHYLPLAGNIMWPPDAPKPAIYYYPNDGVSLIVAESTADFCSLSGNGIRLAVEFHPLIPQLPISDDKAAVIAIQITLFPNEGFCIGITSHHAILDGKSSTMFIKSWAYICKQDKEDPSLLPELTPLFDRSVIKDPAGIDMVYINKWLTITRLYSNSNTRSLKLLPITRANSNLVRATFEFTREDINKLRDKVLSILGKAEKDEIEQAKRLHLSTFVLTCAYVFICLVKAKGRGDNRKVIMGFPADYRARLDPPVPMNYFGNCVRGHGVVAEAKDFTEENENGVALVAKKLSDKIKGLEKELLEGLEENGSKLTTNRQGAIGFGVAGSTRFEVYRTDFGWGRPKKVEIVSIDKNGSISLAESSDGSGGVEVGVVLEKQEMKAFASLFVNGLKDVTNTTQS